MGQGGDRDSLALRGGWRRTPSLEQQVKALWGAASGQPEEPRGVLVCVAEARLDDGLATAVSSFLQVTGSGGGILSQGR